MSEKLYTSKRVGTDEILGYAYGEEWVSQALFMGDLCFKTKEEAVEWWKTYKEKLEVIKDAN